MNLDLTAVEVLACHVVGITKETIDHTQGAEVDSALFEKLGVTLEQFCNVVEALLPYTPTVGGEPFGMKRRGFVKDGYYLILEPVDE